MTKRETTVSSLGSGLFDEALHIVRTTISIGKSHFNFGRQIGGMERPLTDAIRYNVEVLAVVIILSNFVGGTLTVHLLPEFRFSQELEAILYTIGVFATGACGWLAVWLLTSNRPIPAAETIAAYAYWYGFVELASMPIAILDEKTNIDLGSWIGWIIGLATVVVFSLLTKWIADINNIGVAKAFFSFVLAIILFNLIARPIALGLNAAFKLAGWDFAIDPGP